MFTDDYMILPNFLDKNQFGRKVEYVEDYVQRKNNAINVELDAKGHFSAQIHDPTGIVALKSPYWFFQKEFRFVLFILPSIKLPLNGPFSREFAQKMPNFIAQKLYRGEGPNIEFFDVSINPDVLDKIHIITGPCCKESDYLIVDSLLEKYAPNGSINRSKFEGTIRRPKRN